LGFAAVGLRRAGGRPDRAPAWRRYARRGRATGLRADRSAGCPSADRSL